ncbi:MAG: DUF1566 domain-containing protein [Stagnimonas sp.]|nr:DUF1566 domain-containing protein [Stagnimonas sp.]
MNQEQIALVLGICLLAGGAIDYLLMKWGDPRKPVKLIQPMGVLLGAGLLAWSQLSPGISKVEEAKLSVSAATPAFVVNALRFRDGDGQVTDSLTGLSWRKRDSGHDTGWAEARVFCLGLGEGWRLPRVEELQGLYDPRGTASASCGSSSCKIPPQINKLTGSWFWSQQASSDGAEPWVLSLRTGKRYSSPIHNLRGNRALCVRSGKG